MGIMSVVSGVDMQTGDEREPTWQEAIATFNAATPVELVRPPRRITVVYRYSDGAFTATSASVPGFRVTGTSLQQVRRAALEDLAGFLDPAVAILERLPRPEPEVTTAACARTSFSADVPTGFIVLNSSGTAPTYISPVKASLRPVRA